MNFISKHLKSKATKILILILLVSAILRFYRLDYPNTYVFDEVYHGFTAREYLKGNRDAWDPFAKPPPNVAYEWLHPPIGKELMTASLYIFHSTDPWAWRVPGVLLNLISIFLVYKIGLILFKKEKVALLSAFLFSIDGLVFVQSRTGMNDAHLVAFILTSLYFFLNKKLFWAALFMGIALSTKWPGIFLYGLFLPILIFKKQFKQILWFLLIPPLVYLLSYTPYFLLGYQWKDFVELHRQIWWYQTNLKATHGYASPWWSWPLNLYPVWYYVDYHKNSFVSNIFASGNPILFWLGSGAIILTFWEYLQNIVAKNLKNIFSNSKSFWKIFFQSLENIVDNKHYIILIGFLVFWLPWAISPRIMFLYHFSPSVPFLCLALAYQLETFIDSKKEHLIFLAFLGLIILGFILTFPFLTGVPLPKDLSLLFFRFNLATNPF